MASEVVDLPVTREFEHLTTLYTLLSEQATDNVFIGSITNVVQSMNISGVYKSRLPGILVSMGCITRVRKGVGIRPGEIVLNHLPDLETYTYTYKRKRLTSSKNLDTLRGAVEATNRRLPNVDLARWITSVEQQLAEMRQRLDELETRNTEGGNSLAS
jgi:hypothetical protein